MILINIVVMYDHNRELISHPWFADFDIVDLNQARMVGFYDL